MGDSPDLEPQDHALRIQTENLPGPSAPARIPSTRSINSLDGLYSSSPILTPSGSALSLPSSALTPLPSPLVLSLSGTFPSSLSLDGLALGPSPQRKGYGALGVGGGQVAERRNVTNSVPVNGTSERSERSVSTSLRGRTNTDEGLRREEIRATRSRQSSVGDELYV